MVHLVTRTVSQEVTCPPSQLALGGLASLGVLIHQLWTLRPWVVLCSLAGFPGQPGPRNGKRSISCRSGGSRTFLLLVLRS